MAIRVKLDDTLLVNTPQGWDEAEITSRRSQILKGLFLTYSTDLTFWGDGFNYINDILDESYCDTIKVTIETNDCNPDVWEVEFNGIIQLTQITEFDVDKNIITTKIFDDTFDAKINNNKSIKAFVDVGTSKNGVSITPVTGVPIDFFNPTDNFSTYSYSNLIGYRVFDCFEFIIAHMTDDEVGFKSDLLSTDYDGWYLFNGQELRDPGSGRQIEVSFKELFDEMDKKLNLAFAIEPDDTGSYDYRLRLESQAYFEQEDAILTLDNVKGIKMDFNKDELYSNVEIGSNNFDDAFEGTYPPLNFKAFKEEDYTLLGQCNIDKTLDLVSNYIIDTNIIEDVVVNLNDKYDDKTFIVVTDGTEAIKYKEYGTPVSDGITDGYLLNQLLDSTANFTADGVAIGDMAVNLSTGATAQVTGLASSTRLYLDAQIVNSGESYQIRTGPFNYNNPLTNIKVIERFNGGLPNSVIKYLSTVDTANFEAGRTINGGITGTGTIDPVAFDDDSTPPYFDTGGNYDNVNFEYNIPNNGIYGFEASLIAYVNGYLSADQITNGDFTAATDWQFTQGTINLVTNQFETNKSTYLSQSGVLVGGNIYRLRFVVTELTRGRIKVEGNEITEPGVYNININRQSSNTTEALQFEFINDGDFFGSPFSAAIDNISMLATPRVSIDATIVRSDSNGTLIQEETVTRNIDFGINNYQENILLPVAATFPVFKDDIIHVKVDFTSIIGTNNRINIRSGSTFKTVMVDDGGGDILPQDDNNFPIYRYKFDKAISFQDFKNLTNSPEKAVFFSNIATNHLFGWRNDIKYKRKTGKASFDLRSRDKIKKICQTE